MTEIPEEYLLEVADMNPEQRSRYRRASLALDITKLIYSEYYDMSNSEIQAVFAKELYELTHKNMRPKRRVVGRTEEE